MIGIVFPPQNRWKLCVKALTASHSLIQTVKKSSLTNISTNFETLGYVAQSPFPIFHHTESKIGLLWAEPAGQRQSRFPSISILDLQGSFDLKAKMLHEHDVDSLHDHDMQNRRLDVYDSQFPQIRLEQRFLEIGNVDYKTWSLRETAHFSPSAALVVIQCLMKAEETWKYWCILIEWL